VQLCIEHVASFLKVQRVSDHAFMDSIACAFTISIFSLCGVLLAHSGPLTNHLNGVAVPRRRSLSHSPQWPFSTVNDKEHVSDRHAPRPIDRGASQPWRAPRQVTGRVPLEQTQQTGPAAAASLPGVARRRPGRGKYESCDMMTERLMPQQSAGQLSPTLHYTQSFGSSDDCFWALCTHMVIFFKVRELALLPQVLDKVRVREAAMRQAAEAEDYKAAAAQRDALTQLQLQQRRLELEIDEEARTVHYDIGKWFHSIEQRTLSSGCATHSPNRLGQECRTYSHTQDVLDGFKLCCLCAQGWSCGIGGTTTEA